MGADAVYMGTAFMATKECPIPDRHKQMLVESSPADPKVRDSALAPPDPKELEKVMKLRGKIPQTEWLQKLERVLLKQSADEVPDEIDTEEVLRIAAGSLAVAVIDKIVSVKELIDSIIIGAEEIMSSGAVPRLK
jgi:NAD(P)H-dependent flavin oxidoreductase YrpB (nitropropane dioxygenase family)